MQPPRLKSINIKGYRLFGDFSAQFGSLEVIVGSNGSGKSSLFEFLRFLRDGMSGEIPPEIIPGSIGQWLFHIPEPKRFSWDIEIDLSQDNLVRYQGELMGPVGQPNIISEHVRSVPISVAADTATPTPAKRREVQFMEIKRGRGFMKEPYHKEDGIGWPHTNQLTLSIATNPDMKTLYNLREYIGNWSFYNSFSIARDKIRSPVLVEQNPVLHEDAGNLSSVLHYLKTEHESAFGELQQHLRSTIPGFKKLTVKAYGAPGQIMAFWQEEGAKAELTLSDLSDGTLQLLCWIVLCLQPNLPPLICIDEPDLGVHPRTLALLAGLFDLASDRTQILLATHSSYLLTQFDISQIAVMRKENGEAKFLKPKDSKVLEGMLKEFGPEEIESLHISDELEYFA